MKNLTRYILSISSAALAVTMLSGCATANKRMTPIKEEEKARLLQEIEALNEKPELEPDWADYVKDSYPNWRHHYWVDRGQWGNRGYLVGRPPAEAEPVVENAQITPLPPAESMQPAIVESEAPKVATPEKPDKYVVKKGDSLWKIAGKVYGNPLKWHRIYKANKDKIKNPNRIYPNTVLVIPWD